MIFYLKLTLALAWMGLSALVTILLSPFLIRNLNLLRFWTIFSSWGVLKIAGIKVVMKDPERIKNCQPCIYMPNHQSDLDMFTFGRYWPARATAVGKKELFYIPIVGQIFWLAGMQFLDRKKTMKAVDQLKQLSERVRRKKISVGIAPEGTRNRTSEGLLPFKKGGFHLAIALQLPILPMLSSPVITLFDFKNRKVRRGTIHLKTLEPIPTAGLGPDDVETLRDRVYKIMSEEYAKMRTEVDP